MTVQRLRTPLCVLLFLLAATSAGAQAPSLEDCRARIQQNPTNPVVYYCVYRSVLADGRLDDAAALLRQSFESNPEVYRIEMFMGWIDRMRGKVGSDDLLRDAIDGMESTGDVHGVVYGGLELAYRLGANGDFVEAEALLERCALAAQETGDATMEARVWIGQAVFAERHADYSLWLHLTLRAQKVVFPDGPYDIQCSVLDNLGAAYWYLCRYQEAFDVFEEAAHIREHAHDLWGQARSVFNMSLCGASLLHQGSMEIAEYQALLTRGLDLAVGGGNLGAEAEMTLLLGWLCQGDDALQHFERALKISRQHGIVQTEVNALRSLGISLAEMRPQFHDESDQYFLQAKQRARETGQDVLLGEILVAEARLTAVFEERGEGISAHLDALDWLEKLRAPQVGGTIRAQAFSRWTDVYYRLAGFLLQGSTSSATPLEDYELAFRTLERFRARELLEKMEAPRRFQQAVANSASYVPREDVLAQISKVQRVLSDAKLVPADRQAALRELDDLETLESDLRDQLLRESPEYAALYQPTIPDIATVQALLGPDQALLSYQLWDGESSKQTPLDIGESWLMVITRDTVQTMALPKRKDLRGRVEILEGLISTENGAVDSTAKASVRLYEDLLKEALALIPGETRRLVIIPDDILFRCPFAGLRSSADAPPIADRFEISIVPSAAVWTHLKYASLETLPGPGSAALIFHSPSVGENDGDGNHGVAADPWMAGLQLEPLRHAGREARTLERVAGKGSLVLSGDDASEWTLKTTVLGDFGIVNLATHAVVDEQQPERSAILLAPGSDVEDGFLQVREIPALDLDGQLVILSSCRSLSGRMLGGEGAQSLALAFLEAGAGAVLASLWPLEDEAASIMFSSFSRSLGQGLSVSGALSVAQRTAVEAEMPAASWAGLVILGDGDLKPLPDESHPPWAWVLVVVAVTVSYVAFRVLRPKSP